MSTGRSEQFDKSKFASKNSNGFHRLIKGWKANRERRSPGRSNLPNLLVAEQSGLGEGVVAVVSDDDVIVEADAAFAGQFVEGFGEGAIIVAGGGVAGRVVVDQDQPVGVQRDG